ncbi:hypothetical protein AAMO2058_001249100 [Amorphochlora amoebiformis]
MTSPPPSAFARLFHRSNTLPISIIYLSDIRSTKWGYSAYTGRPETRRRESLTLGSDGSSISSSLSLYIILER